MFVFAAIIFAFQFDYILCVETCEPPHSISRRMLTPSKWKRSILCRQGPLVFILRSSTAFCLLLCYCVEPIVEWSCVTKTKPWSRLLYGDRGIKGQHRTKSFPSNVFSQRIFNHICHIYQTEYHENHADAHSALFMPTDYGSKVNFVVFALSLAENRDKKSWNFSLDIIMKCVNVLWGMRAPIAGRWHLSWQNNKSDLSHGKYGVCGRMASLSVGSHVRGDVHVSCNSFSSGG